MIGAKVCESGVLNSSWALGRKWLPRTKVFIEQRLERELPWAQRDTWMVPTSTLALQRTCSGPQAQGKARPVPGEKLWLLQQTLGVCGKEAQGTHLSLRSKYSAGIDNHPRLLCWGFQVLRWQAWGTGGLSRRSRIISNMIAKPVANNIPGKQTGEGQAMWWPWGLAYVTRLLLWTLDAFLL